MGKQRLLIVGLGSIGERHLRCAKQIARSDVLACEVNRDLLQAVADRYRVNEAHDSLESAMAAGPTAAVICVPAPLHVPMATQLVESGVHVLIEKPLSTSLEGVGILQTAVATKAVVAAVAYVHRANPYLIAVREAIRSERFGKPLQLVAVTGQNFPFYRPAYRETYYRDRASGGGAIQDALTHLVNAGEWLIGPADRVIADADHLALPGVTVEDTVHVIARHGTVPACYALNQHQAPNELTITIVCQRGTLRYEAHANRWRWMNEPSGQWHDEGGQPIDRDELFIAQLNAFFDAIENGSPPFCSLAEGVQTLKVNLALLKSIEQTAWMPV